MALFPNQIYQVTSLQLEATFTFLVMATLAIAVDHDWSTGPPSRRRLAAVGAVLAVSMLVRPFSAPVLLALLLALLVAAGWRRALGLLAVPVLVVVAAFVPWTIRNAIAFGDFIPSSTNMGDTLCIDRNLDATGGFRWAMHDGCVDPGLPEHSRNRGNTRKAIEFVISHPDRELLQIVRRAKLIFAEDNDGIQAVETMGSGEIFSSGTRRFFVVTADWYLPPRPGGGRAGLAPGPAGHAAGRAAPRVRALRGADRHPPAAVGQPPVPPAVRPLPRAVRGGDSHGGPRAPRRAPFGRHRGGGG